MLVGLKGSGKTTTAAKLALHLRKQGGRPLMVAADPYRVAAGEQLKALGRQLGIPVYAGEEGQSLPDLCTASLGEAQAPGRDRPHRRHRRPHRQIDGEMMTEITQMSASLKPTGDDPRASTP